MHQRLVRYIRSTFRWQLDKVSVNDAVTRYLIMKLRFFYAPENCSAKLVDNP